MLRRKGCGEIGAEFLSGEFGHLKTAWLLRSRRSSTPQRPLHCTTTRRKRAGLEGLDATSRIVTVTLSAASTADMTFGAANPAVLVQIGVQSAVFSEEAASTV